MRVVLAVPGHARRVHLTLKLYQVLVGGRLVLGSRSYSLVQMIHGSLVVLLRLLHVLVCIRGLRRGRVPVVLRGRRHYLAGEAGLLADARVLVEVAVVEVVLRLVNGDGGGVRTARHVQYFIHLHVVLVPQQLFFLQWRLLVGGIAASAAVGSLTI